MPHTLLNAVNQLHIAIPPSISNPFNPPSTHEEASILRSNNIRAGNPIILHIAASPPNNPASTQGEASTSSASIIRSASTTISNGLWSAHAQPAYDLDFSQFLSPELNEGYYLNRVLSADLVADVTLESPLDFLNLYSAPLMPGGHFLSPVDYWPIEYDPHKVAAETSVQVEPKQEITSDDNKEDVVSVEAVPLIRKEKGPKEKIFHPCPQCARKFSRRFNMITHMKTHDKDRSV
jgi:hypothetical protein